MEVKAYRIKDWDKYFEKADTRKCVTMKWIALPVKHDGKGFRRIASHAQSCEIFAGWVLICQVAAKMPTRGILVDEDGPVTVEDMAVITGFPKEIFELAFEVLTDKKIGWLEEMPG